MSIRRDGNDEANYLDDTFDVAELVVEELIEELKKRGNFWIELNTEIIDEKVIPEMIAIIAKYLNPFCQVTGQVFKGHKLVQFIEPKSVTGKSQREIALESFLEYRKRKNRT